MPASTNPEPAIGGACLCGAVAFEITLPSNWCANCHCSMCRRAHGAGYVVWVSVPRAQFRVTQGEDTLGRYRSSDAATRSFCKTCGSPLFFESTRWAGEMHVARAAIPGPIDRTPQVHAFYSDKAEWVDLEREAKLPLRGGKTGVEPLK